MIIASCDICLMPNDRFLLELPTGSTIRLVGRYDLTAAGAPRLSWTGSQIFLRFFGTSLAMKVNAHRLGTEADGQPMCDFWQITVDQNPPMILATPEGVATYQIAADLELTEHEVVIYKRTESLVGFVDFLDFDYGASGKNLAPAPAPAASRHLEFIGDSITAGFGLEAANEQCKFSAATENSYGAFAQQTALALRAEAHLLAWSGRGVYRNYDETTVETMPELYERTLPHEASPDRRWDFSHWPADAVVINLGTNDFHAADPAQSVPPRQDFVSAYVHLLDKVQQHHPTASIWCCLGPMISAEHRPIAAAYVKEAQASFSQKRNLSLDIKAQLHYLEFDRPLSGDGFGADFHPSRATQAKMADRLTLALKKNLGW